MISIFDLFTIGVGPSSSHTIGPMRAAATFMESIKNVSDIEKLTIELFGSLAHTGKGHGTDKAILMGIEGHWPKDIDPDYITPRFDEITKSKKIKLLNQHEIDYDPNTQLIFNYEELLPRHTNGMRFTTYDKDQKILNQENYYSIGGGFIVTEIQKLENAHDESVKIPYPFDTADELLEICETNNLSIASVMMANESSIRSDAEIREGILNMVNVMMQSIERGCEIEGFLPGVLKVHRRAPKLAKKLKEKMTKTTHEHIDSIDWLNIYAIAVNEENAAGSRVVTAPTNGASGVLPAVLKYYKAFHPGSSDDKVIEYMLTAAAIAILYKKGASLSAAEVGCQGEVGVASSMAAGAYTAVLDGEVRQVTSAAEIAMEHNLGLTCDPIAGLVQIPCIERNAIGAVKAVNCARLSLMEGVSHKKVSLDKVIDTMYRTGIEMSSQYKETSKGGLAKIRVNVIEC